MKGQVSFEYLVYFTLILLISSFFIINQLNTNQRLNHLKMDVEADELAEKIAFEINSAVIAGDGYERKFFLEEKIGGYSSYTVETGDYYILVDWDGRSKIASINTKSVNGTIGEKWNLIRNVNGVIYVN